MTFVFWIEEPCDTNRTVMLHGILISVIWPPGWEGSLGENGYVYVCIYTYGLVAFLST